MPSNRCCGAILDGWLIEGVSVRDTGVLERSEAPEDVLREPWRFAS